MQNKVLRESRNLRETHTITASSI